MNRCRTSTRHCASKRASSLPGCTSAWRRPTMIYVTHDQVEAMTLADRIVVLNLGRVEQVGTPMELYQKPATRFVAGFIGSPRMKLHRGRDRGDARRARLWHQARESGDFARGRHMERNRAAVGRAGQRHLRPCGKPRAPARSMRASSGATSSRSANPCFLTPDDGAGPSFRPGRKCAARLTMPGGRAPFPRCRIPAPDGSSERLAARGRAVPSAAFDPWREQCAMSFC